MNDPYQIEVHAADEIALDKLMTDSQLPYELLGNRILTDPSHGCGEILGVANKEWSANKIRQSKSNRS